MGTRFEGTEDERAALDAYIRFQRASETLHAQVQSELAEYGLTTSQFAAMEAVFHLGPLCLKDIGTKILKSGGNMTLVIDNLEKAGYVRRARSTTDRRQVLVHLTDEGRRKMAEIFPRHVTNIQTLLGVLTREERAALGALSRKLGLGIRALSKG